MDKRAPAGDAPETEDDDLMQADSVQELRFVGIAASAGGLEAVSLLVQNLPQEANAIYIVAQHMSPTHKSVLSTLISRETRLPVAELDQETEPEANTIYVTPPNTDVVLERGSLRLRNPSGHPASPKPSADRLFKSLAEEVGEHCVGVVLSGTGSDGSYGVQSIREAGGITIAQEPSSAKYDGMPTSAMETGCIDLTLSPEQIGTHLEKILANPRNFDGLRSLQDMPKPLSELFAILLARTQVDFRDYKENTLNRRIARRMTALGIEDYETYVDYCRTNVDEVDALHRDLLISVTRFFRDPDQFTKLQTELRLTLDERPNSAVRVWAVGCATGEEAYSIAIILAELLGGIEQLSQRKVQIFATDIDQAAIEVARKGVYPISAAQDVPSDMLSQYFTLSDTEITVRPELRAVTLFSQHNVFQDPPFINVDLVSIRNLLIYFNLALQERVLSRLHYAMTGGGLLFLGTSETVGEMGVYFEARQGADKIFSKRRGISGELKVDASSRSYRRGARKQPATPGGALPADTAEAQLSLARAVAPNGMICTRSGNIIEVLGDISPFMEIRAGASTSLNIKMLIEPLRSEAASLLAVAIRNEGRRNGRWHPVSLPVGNRVQLQVFPFYSHTGGEMHSLMAINTRFEEDAGVPFDDITDDEQRAHVERMELEIRSTQEALQQTIEELQTANEELQSANEEMQSTNEEFQATNEELETSNEELQSTNEELLTVNEELQISSAERQALASELEATMVSAPYSLALADQALMVRRMSNVALRTFGLPELAPTGVHLSQCNLPPGFPALAPLANTVLRLQETRLVPVLSEGKYYSMVMSPVHDVHRKLIGLSITITQNESEPLAQVVGMMADISNVAYWTYNLDSDDLFWSHGMFDIYGREDSGILPDWNTMFTIVHPGDRDDFETLVKRLMRDGGYERFEHRAFGLDGKIIRVRGSIIANRDSHGDTVQLIGAVWDIATQSERDQHLASLSDMQNALGIGFFSYQVQNYEPYWNQAMFDLLGLDMTADQPSVETMLKQVCAEQQGPLSDQFAAALSNGQGFSSTIRVGDQHLLCLCETQRDPNGKVVSVYGALQRSGTDAVA